MRKSHYLQQMDETWNHFAKRNKSERQILYDLNYKWNLKQNKTQNKNIILVVTSSEGWKEGKLEQGGQKLESSTYKISK